MENTIYSVKSNVKYPEVIATNRCLANVLKSALETSCRSFIVEHRKAVSVDGIRVYLGEVLSKIKCNRSEVKSILECELTQ